MINYAHAPQKIAFDKLFNARMYNHYGSNDGWVTARLIEVHRNTLKALVKQGLAEEKQITSWHPSNRFWYRLKYTEETMNVICSQCKHRREDDNICLHGYNQMHGRKGSKGGTIICERFSAILKKGGKKNE